NNQDELRLCYKDAAKKIVGRRKDMQVEYLQKFLTKKTVSLSAIESLRYVTSLFKLSDKALASLFVDVAGSLRKAPASRGKLLFFGERLLPSPAGLASLQPIRDMLASNYRKGGAEIVLVAQQTMAASAYKAMVVAAGDAEGLVDGWAELGMTEEQALDVAEDAKEQGFKSDALDYYYQGPPTEYDDNGNEVHESVKKDDDPYADLTESQRAARGLPKAGAAPAPKKPEPAEGTSAYECGECGYTLFPAAGREEKFYGPDFTCPNCNAGKDKFFKRGEE
ncbi:hypothetical protein TeGR_g11053, partial [Tetraparma gracilis]